MSGSFCEEPSLRALGIEVAIITGASSGSDQVERLFDATFGRWSRLDVMANNAATYVRKRLVETTLEDCRSGKAKLCDPSYADAALRSSCRRRQRRPMLGERPVDIHNGVNLLVDCGSMAA
jgi:hypothetical protein